MVNKPPKSSHSSIDFQKENRNLQIQIDKAQKKILTLENKILKLENKTLRQEQQIIKLETENEKLKREKQPVSFNIIGLHDEPPKK